MSYALAVTNPTPKQRVVSQVVAPTTQSPPKTVQPSKKESPQQQINVTPPNTTGVSPVVIFELKIPSAQKKEQEGTEDSLVDLTESFDENEDEQSNESENNKQSKSPKFTALNVDGLEQRQAKINDLVSYLLNNCDDKDFEIVGGFKIFKGVVTKDGNKKTSLPQFDLKTIPQALGWVKSIVDLLRNSQTVSVALDDQDELLFVRSGNQVRVTRNNGSKNNEVWFQFEDLALEIRDQGKKYLKVAQAVEDTLERKESRAGDKSKKDQMKKKRIAVSDKLQTRTFRSLLKTMKDLFLSSDLPALKEKYQKQEQIKDQNRKRLIEQNRDMMSMALNAAPSGFMEMDISHIGHIEEPQEIVEEAPVVQQNVTTETSQDTPPVVKEKRKKKRTKAEIRRAQEENFDTVELQNGSIVESVQETTSSNVQSNETNQPQGSAYQNSFDLGEISQENIFEITQSETRTNTVENKKNKSNTKQQQQQKKSGNKKSTDNSGTKSQQPAQVQAPKKKNKAKNEKAKAPTQSQIQKEEKQSVNTSVLVLAGAASIVVLYYAYTLLQ